MPRPRRTAPGGLVYHVLNRANNRRPIFLKDADYRAFELLLAEVRQRVPMRILAWCLMPNHWHLVLWPEEDGQLSNYVRLVTLTHTQRWHAHYGSTGSGHLYQGRFKSFAVESDAYFLSVCRYVEANALRASLVRRAEDWRWSSLWCLKIGEAQFGPRIDRWPVERPTDWMKYVNESSSSSELYALRNSAHRGTPYGSPAWVNGTAARFGLQCTLRPRGRPHKQTEQALEGGQRSDPF